MFKQTGPLLARYLTRRPIRRSAKSANVGSKQKKVKQRGKDTSDSPNLDVDRLIRVLPTLPPHQQEVVKSLLNNQGREKVNELLRTTKKTVESGNSNAIADGNGGIKPPPTLSIGGRKHLRNKMMYDQETSLETLQAYFQVVAENPTNFDKLFWKSVFQYYKMSKVQGTVINPDEPPPYQFFVELFELAKLQKAGRIRFACVKVAGDILYSYNTVRMDPFNEVEYLDSLSYFGNTYKAIELWKSRRYRDDVKESIYWLEVGILYHQQAKYLVAAERLTDEMVNQFNYIQPSVVVGFISSYASTGQIDSIDKWVDKFIELIEVNECKLSNEKINDGMIDSEQAQSIFNDFKSPSIDQLEKAIKVLLENNLWNQSAKLIEYLEKCGVNDSVKQMLQVLDSTTRRLVDEVQKPKSLIPRQHRRNKKLLAPENNKQLMVVISKIISVYPEVLEYPKFYETWLRGLAGLELYDNAIMVVEAMVDRGIKPTHGHIISLIRSLLGKNEITIALDLLERLENPPSDLYPSPTPSIYGLFISYGARRSDHEFVNKIVNRMFAQGLEHSPPTFNTLLFYYYRHKDFNSIFKLLQSIRLSNNFELNHMNYRTIWKILRDYYYLSSHNNLPVRLNEIDVEPPNLRSLFIDMINNKNFKLSMNVFENVIYTMLLAGDYKGVASVLCYMDTVNNIKIPGILVVGTLQLATKITTNTSYSLPKFPKHDLIVSPGYESESSASWDLVVQKLCEILEIDHKEIIDQARDMIENLNENRMIN